MRCTVNLPIHFGPNIFLLMFSLECRCKNSFTFKKDWLWDLSYTQMTHFLFRCIHFTLYLFCAHFYFLELGIYFFRQTEGCRDWWFDHSWRFNIELYWCATSYCRQTSFWLLTAPFKWWIFSRFQQFPIILPIYFFAWIIRFILIIFPVEGSTLTNGSYILVLSSPRTK